MRSIIRAFLLIGLLFLNACTTHSPAPVIDRAPQINKPASPKSTTNNLKDWRPDTHTVAKGDTLYAIGLQYGLDYKDIAQINQLNPPYAIQIGQILKIKDNQSSANILVKAEPEEDVITSPIRTENGIIGSTASTNTPVLNTPKATKEIYSDSVYGKPSNSKSEESAANTNKTNNDNNADDELSWSLPTAGKITGLFNESSNKGVDFEGKIGQAINAAAAGKIIYAGADLRGYGKLVIIKHNKTYLSVYAHNSKILVKEGQMINIGQKIAEMGNTDTDKVKLHFEIRKQGKSVNPEKYLPKN